MTDEKPKNQTPSNPCIWRTHASVLRHNYPVTETVEKKAGVMVRRFHLEGHEVMEERMIASVSADRDSCDVHTYSQALGSFRGDLQARSYIITREQFEFLKEIWK